ncbi:hypothetical protein D3C71_1732090 [compost metagenome]
MVRHQNHRQSQRIGFSLWQLQKLVGGDQADSVVAHPDMLLALDHADGVCRNAQSLLHLREG